MNVRVRLFITSINHVLVVYIIYKYIGNFLLSSLVISTRLFSYETTYIRVEDGRLIFIFTSFLFLFFRLRVKD